MSIEKAELKMAAAHEIGVRLDDSLEVAQKDVIRCEGSVLAARQIADKLQSKSARVQDAIEKGSLALEEGKRMMVLLGEAVTVAQEHAASSEQARIMAHGRVAAFGSAIGHVLKYRQEEEAKARALVEAVATNGRRVAPSIKQQRAKKAKARRGKDS